jgi:hypothetical protein
MRGHDDEGSDSRGRSSGTTTTPSGEGSLENDKTIMSDADVECYKKEYTDLNGMDPRKHFVTIGKGQGRQQHCAK